MSNQDKPPIDEDDPHAGSAFDGRDVARDPFLDDDDDDGDSFDSKSDPSALRSSESLASIAAFSFSRAARIVVNFLMLVDFILPSE